MQSWIITGSSITPCAQPLREHRWPVSKTSISGRTPSAWICRAIAFSMAGVFVIT